MLGGEHREIYLKNNNSRLGVIVSGGNAVGIFVSEILPDGLAARHNELRRGDQILEVSYETSLSEKRLSCKPIKCEHSPKVELSGYVHYLVCIKFMNYIPLNMVLNFFL